MSTMHFDPSRLHLSSLWIGVLVWLLVLVLVALFGPSRPMRGDEPGDFHRWRAQARWPAASYREFLRDTWRHRNPGSRGAYAMAATGLALLALLQQLISWGALTWGHQPAQAAPGQAPAHACPVFAGDTYDLAGSPLAGVLLEQPHPRQSGSLLRLGPPQHGGFPQATWWTPDAQAQESAPLWMQQCEDGWLLSRVLQSVKGADGVWRDHEYWLGRDRDGALLVRERMWRLYGIGSWGGSAFNARLTWTTRMHRLPAIRTAPRVDPPHAALPAAPRVPAPQAPASQAAPAGPCPQHAARQRAFVERIRPGLPPGVTVWTSAPARSPGCAVVAIELGLEAPTQPDLLRGEAVAKADAEVRAVELLYATPGSAGKARRLLHVELR